MSERQIRQNKITHEWVIFAPGRGERPRDTARHKVRRDDIPEYHPQCPFCPGNEDKLPPIIDESSNRSTGTWRTRVVLNKYPALIEQGDLERRFDGFFVSMDGWGRHEVIIENPAHNKQIATMTPDEVGRILETYRRRYSDLLSTTPEPTVVIFRNHGTGAGTSLIHPHSQLIATGWMPAHVRRREEQATHYFDSWGRCAFCDVLKAESRRGERKVYENESFFCFVPFAASVPCETWIMPKRHEPDFGAISDAEAVDLSHALHTVLLRMDEELNDPDYNYVIDTYPCRGVRQASLHWLVRVLPRLTTPAGFEIGSGININTSLPEDDAAMLRD